MKKSKSTSKVALVTGAASGLGFELSLLLARDNYDLILVDIDAEKLKSVKTDLVNDFDARVQLMVKDLSQPNIAQEIFEEIQDTPIEVLINNAGFGGLPLKF